MSVTTTQVVVTTAATALNTAGGRLDDVSGCSIYNAGAQTVFLGGSTVTTGTGVPLVAGATVTFDSAPGDILFGIVAATTANVNVMQARK